MASLYILSLDPQTVRCLAEFATLEGDFGPIRSGSSLDEGIRKLRTFRPDILVVDTYRQLFDASGQRQPQLFDRLLAFPVTVQSFSSSTQVYFLWNYLDEVLKKKSEATGAVSLDKIGGLSSFVERFRADLGPRNLKSTGSQTDDP